MARICDKVSEVVDNSQLILLSDMTVQKKMHLFEALIAEVSLKRREVNTQVSIVRLGQVHRHANSSFCTTAS